MKKAFILTQFMVLMAAASMLVAQPTSTWVFTGSDNRLHYKTDSQGNRIMDFSLAGYQGGGVALPVAPVVVTVNPSSGDDTANIQAAIDSVSQRTPNAAGIRGAVLLGPGTFDISATLSIATSGVVLRGSGSGSGGTVLNLTVSPHLALSVQGSGSWQTVGSSVSITDAYVPSGSVSFNVSDASGFSVGDSILIERPVTQPWIHFMGMDTLVSSTGTPQTWISAGTLIPTDRNITAISGNRITLDAPLADSFDATLLNPPGGAVVKYTFAGRIFQVGIEHLKVVGAAVNVDINSPQYLGVSLSAVQDGWMQDVVFQDTQNTVTIGNTARRLTLDNVHVTHTVVHTGDRMADFGISGTQIFVNKSSSDGTGEWPLLTQGRVTGPIVALNFNSSQQAGVGPHQRWAVGLLCDECTLPNAPNNVNGGATGINYSDRGNHGSGQGWAMGWGVAWNATTPFLVVQEPPGAHNWCIGCIGQESSGTEPGSGKPVPNGIFESLGAHVAPASLYLAQLKDRLGNAAIANIGYGDFSLSATPGSRTVTAGAATTYTVTVTPSGVFNDNLSLNVSGLPAGAQGTFSPASLASGNATLNISTSTTTPVGSSTLTITGTSGNLKHAIPLTLVVNARPVTSYEAEAAGNTFSGSTAPGACSGCSGGTKVRFIGNNATNFLTINNVNVSAAGSYVLTIYYVVSGTRSFSISVNGGTAIPFTVSGTTWNAPGTPVSVTIPLNAGNNTVKMFNNSAFAPDLDRITIQ
jgi:hypothetical protein